MVDGLAAALVPAVQTALATSLPKVSGWAGGLLEVW